MLSNPNAYVALSRRLRAMRRYDEMLALASALFALKTAVLLVERAQQAHDLDNARRFKREAMVARRELEYATHAVIEVISVRRLKSTKHRR
jgi:hypothetical protein